MKINKQLNLIVEVENDSGEVLHVHSTPLARETFDKYWLVMSKAFNAIYAEGLGLVAGPRIATRMLKLVAENMDQWKGDEGIENGLLAEIRRLTNVLVPTADGWQQIMYADAVRQELISAEDADEVEGIIVFFILNSALQRQTEKKRAIDAGVQLWGGSTTLYTLTEYRSYLLTLKEAANTNPPSSTSGEKLAAEPIAPPSLVAY